MPLLPSTYTSPSVVVPIIAERIALPSDRHAVPLLDLLPPDMAVTYALPSNLFRKPEEIRALNDSKPLLEPRVGGSRAQYLALLRRMLAVDKVAFTASPLAVNGLFAVAKDETSDRLIIDAQPANRLFAEPPHVSLPNASHLVQLQLVPSSSLANLICPTCTTTSSCPRRGSPTSACLLSRPTS